MGILGKKELIVGIIKSGVNMEHPCGIVLRASDSLVVLLTV